MGNKKLILLMSCLVTSFTYLVFHTYVEVPTTMKLSVNSRSQRFYISLVNNELRKNKDRKSDSPYIDPISLMDVNKTVFKFEVTHTILYWNSVPWLTESVLGKDMSLCIYNNCKITFDRSLLTKSSAVIFNLADFGIGDKPPVSQHHRNPNQTWVFLTIESPEHMQKREVMNPSWQNVFNWSWTYRRRSDIFQPYGIMVSGNNVSARNYIDIFRKKTKTTAWVVSHCNTHSKREDYVKILQKYIDVDIFGKCGKSAPADLLAHISMNYKFYLSFENSLCEDYVTEKFFRYYKLDVITVVRGMNNYGTFFPNGSFVDAANFSSISELAKFMRNLADNEEEYIQYLKIKDMYSVYEHEFVSQNVVCNLCEKLNNLDKNRNIISDALQWLGQCNLPVIN